MVTTRLLHISDGMDSMDRQISLMEDIRLGSQAAGDSF